jgi:hypothetical protein
MENSESKIKGYTYNKDKAALKAKLSNLTKSGRKIITTKDELKTYPLGSIVSYITNDGIFNLGGFLYKIKKKSFMLITDLINFDTDDIKINTFDKAYFDNIREIYIGRVDEVINDVISIQATSQKKTNYPVSVGDTIVYYARDKNTQTRYKCTDKFQRMTKWHEIFGDQ